MVTPGGRARVRAPTAMRSTGSTSCATFTAGSPPRPIRRARLSAWGGAPSVRWPTRATSIRCATCRLWFAVDDGLAHDRRCGGARPSGHDRDLTVAAILEAAGEPAVEEPRLSTTYDAAGAPARMGLELWLPEQEGEQPYPAPRRGRGGRRRRQRQRRRRRAHGTAAALPQPRQRRDRRLPAAATAMSRIEAVISDFGGVLTSPLLDSFAAFQEARGHLARASRARRWPRWRPGRARTRCSSWRRAG